MKKRREVIRFIVGRSESVWKHKEGSKSYNKETGKKGKTWLNKERKGETRKDTIEQGRRHSWKRKERQSEKEGRIVT